MMLLRIPLIRSGNDKTPVVWWEWLFCPIVMTALFVIFAIVAILSIPYTILFSIVMAKRERELKREFAQVGRLLADDDLKVKLEAGHGTLIVTHEGTKGPVHEWWTEDDVIGDAPSPLPDSFDNCMTDDLIAFAQTCIKKYIDPGADNVMLTNGTFGMVDSSVANTFPHARVVTIFNWFPDAPAIAQGHFADQHRRH